MDHNISKNSNHKLLKLLFCAIIFIAFYPISLSAKSGYQPREIKISKISQNRPISLRSIGELSNADPDNVILTVLPQGKKDTLTGIKFWMTKILESINTKAYKQEAIQIETQLPLNFDRQKLNVFSVFGDSMSVKIHFDKFNLEDINGLIDVDKWQNIEGIINGHLHIYGSSNNLQITGKILLQDGKVKHTSLDIIFEEIESAFVIESDRLILEKLSAKSGDGTLSAKGVIHLENSFTEMIDIELQAQNFTLANSDYYKGIVNLNLHLGGTISSPHLRGNLNVLAGYVELYNFGEEAIEDITLNTASTQMYNIYLYDSLSLDIDVQFNERFIVQNQQYLKMQLQLDGQLNLQKNVNEYLNLTGKLNAADGYAEPLGKQFELVNGLLTFTGPIYNPQINLRTLYQPHQAEQNIKIWYIIEGTIEDPRFKFKSTPPMELRNIISYTLFGQPYYRLYSVEQAVVASVTDNTAADFAAEILLNRMEDMAMRELGADVVKINNTNIGGESGTAITTGWYINPRVFFAIQNVITGSTPTLGFFLEYYLNENLILILKQGNDRGQGIDLQWEYDY